MLQEELARRGVNQAEQPKPSLAEYCESTLTFKLHDWQHQMCARLDELKHQTGQRLMIHKPPQFGGSVIVSQRLAPFIIGHQPDARVALACYNVTHAAGFGEMIRGLMQDDSFRVFGPDAQLEKSDPGAEKFRTVARAKRKDAQYSFMALGLLSGFTGKGADLLIIDDPYASADDARSEAINERVWRWWTQTAGVRINDDTNVVVMFHRYHEDDFAGRLLAQGGWEYWRFPAVAEASEHNDDGSDRTGRTEGEVLSPIRSREFLQAIQDREPQVWLGQYQGRPRPPEGAIIKREWLRVEPALPKIDFWVRFWDLASGAESRLKGDYFAGALVGISENQTVWIKDIERTRGEWPDVCEIIADTAQRDYEFAQRTGADYAVGVEKVAWQMAMIQDLERTAPFKHIPFWPIVPKGDKLQRALGWITRARHDRLRLLQGDWNQEFINECIAFDGLGLTHDDQIDGVSGAYGLLWQFRASPPEPEPLPAGSVAFYREQAAQMGTESPFADDDDDDFDE